MQIRDTYASRNMILCTKVIFNMDNYDYYFQNKILNSLV